jgi:hypothetical protein
VKALSKHFVKISIENVYQPVKLKAYTGSV